jgi:hypothetical protein
MLFYLKTFQKGRVIIDTSYPDHSLYPVEDHSNWMELYPDTGEVILKDLPLEEGPRVRMTVYVDTDHAHDLVTRRSITGILVMLNNTLLDGPPSVRRQWRCQLMAQDGGFKDCYGTNS